MDLLDLLDSTELPESSMLLPCRVAMARMLACACGAVLPEGFWRVGDPEEEPPAVVPEPWLFFGVWMNMFAPHVYAAR